MKSLRIMIRNSLLIKFAPGTVKMYFDRRVENNLSFILRKISQTSQHIARILSYVPKTDDFYNC